jgi:hypothetical protein
MPANQIWTTRTVQKQIAKSPESHQLHLTALLSHARRCCCCCWLERKQQQQQQQQDKNLAKTYLLRAFCLPFLFLFTYIFYVMLLFEHIPIRFEWFRINGKK